MPRISTKTTYLEMFEPPPHEVAPPRSDLKTERVAWSHRPTRVWVHTCDLDYPAALSTYLKAGFRIYDEKMIDQFVPDEYDPRVH